MRDLSALSVRQEPTTHDRGAMMRWLRHGTAALAGVVILAVLAGSIWAGLERNRDPLSAIHLPPGAIRTVVDSSYTAVPAADPGSPVPLVIAQVPPIRRAVLQVPAQVTLLARPFDAMIMAYGGADIRALLQANPRIRSRPIRNGVAAGGATLVHALEPGRHLPHLPGRFLIIRGDRDTQIPTPLAEGLAELTPEPKDVVVLAAGHMGPRDPELTARVVAISRDWLVRQGVIDRDAAADGG